MITDKQTIFEALERAMREEGYQAGRKDGFAEGYAQALTDMTTFAKDRLPPEMTSVRAAPSLFDDIPEPDRQRRPKGENARFVREVLSEATAPLNASEVRRRVAKKTGKPITYSSTRNALFQLRADKVVAEEQGQWSLIKEDTMAQ